jgi:chemotaxis protein methyltransferase CheR
VDGEMTAAPGTRIDEIEARLLLQALHQKYGHDFREYAPAFLMRRLQLAQQHFGCPTISRLQERLLREPALLPEMLGILTIQVSEMFRDPGYYKALREHVLPHLATWPSLKVWVAGCAGGGGTLFSFNSLPRGGTRGTHAVLCDGH